MANFWMNKNSRIITDLGFGRMGGVQRFVDFTIASEMDSMVPLDTGALKNSVHGSVMGSGRLVYDTPYAKEQFYKGKDVDGAGRGRLWSVRYQKLFAKKLTRKVQKYIESYGGGGLSR